MPFPPVLRSRRLSTVGFATALFIVSSVGLVNGGTSLQLDPANSVATYMACLQDKGAALVSAHRGGPQKGYPENALETLQHTVAYGPMLLEVDVRETADGHFVLLHDKVLDRTTTGTGELHKHTLAELKDIRLLDNEGNVTGFAIPTLADVLVWANDRAIIQLDIKRGIDYAKVAKAVVKADAVDSVLLIAYRLENALAAMKIDKSFSFSMSLEGISELESIEAAGVSREQIVAWTGVADRSTKSVWSELEALEIPMAAGAFWALEKEIMQSGNPQPYIDLAQAGVDVVAADHYPLAFDTLAKQQDLGKALSACEGR